jgi:cytochrome c-type biogenesis protein CcmH
MMRATLLGVTLAIALAASATKMDATDAALDLRLKKLETELRCLVCQNQTIADSNADLAGDLRREVRDLALAGKTDAQIREYLVARYGDFVLYDPPLKWTTTLLWIGPFAMLVAGAGLWLTLLRRRVRTAAAAPPPKDSEAHARARARLDGQDNERSPG